MDWLIHIGFKPQEQDDRSGQSRWVHWSNRLLGPWNHAGLARSVMFLFVFIIFHAVGKLEVFMGLNDFNGFGYFYVRLYLTGLGFSANIMEEYVLRAAMLHAVVASKQT